MDHYYWFFLFCILCSAPGQSSTKSSNAGPIKVHFIHSGFINDFAYNYAMEKARIDLVVELHRIGTPINSTYNENVTVPELPDIIARLERENYDLLVATSSTFTTDLQSRAARHPTLKFSIFDAGLQSAIPSNAVLMNTMGYNGRFMAGYVCGLLSTTGKVGIVMPFTKSLNNIITMNSYLLGAKLAGPGITVGYVAVDGCESELASRAAARSLYEWGADCLHGAQSSTAMWSLWSSYRFLSVGYFGDMRVKAGENVVTSTLSDPTQAFRYLLLTLMAGNWDTIAGTVLFTPNALMLSPFSLNMPRHLRSPVTALLPNVSMNSEQIFAPGVCPSIALDPLACATPQSIYNPKYMKISPLLEFVAEWTQQTALQLSYWNYKDAFSIVSLAFAGFLILVCLAFLTHICVYRHSKVYETSSINFLVCLLIGCMVLAGASIVFVGKPDAVRCATRVWFKYLGADIIVSAIMAKVWKLRHWGKQGFSTVTSPNLSKYTTSAFDLFKFMGPILIARLCSLTFYQAMDPDTAQFLVVNDVLGIIDSSCAPQTRIYYAINATLLVLECILALILCLTASSNSILKDNISVYTWIVLDVLFIYCVALAVNNLAQKSKLQAGIYIWTLFLHILLVFILVFIPKWWTVQVDGVKEPLEDGTLSVDQSVMTSTKNSIIVPEVPVNYGDFSESSAQSAISQSETGTSREPNGTSPDLQAHPGTFNSKSSST